MDLQEIYSLIDGEWNGSKYKRPNLVIKLCNQALSLDPSSVQVLYSKGLAYLSLGDVNSAESCFSQAVNKNPQFWTAWHSLGVCNEYKERIAAALYCYSKARKYEKGRV